MHRHSQYHDLLASEGPEFGFGDAPDDYETSMQYWCNFGEFQLIDPQLHSLSLHDMNAHYQRPMEGQHPYAAYDPIAHGFSHRYSRAAVHSLLPQLGGFDPDQSEIEQLRHLRHFSPTDSLGIALSSNSDSSVSDYPLSPEAVRSSFNVPFSNSNQEFYGVPMAAASSTSLSWNQQPSFMSPHPPTPVPANHTVPSMRYLQVTPDPDHDDETVDDREALHSKINFPVELEMSEQIVSPPDSGLDQSVHDDETMKDEEEDSGAIESDNDSEFVPQRNTPRRQHGTTRRHSMREPRRARSVIDPRARVQKPTHAGEMSHNGSSRPKSKKKHVLLKKDESDSKHFPCAFHHYGCCATFGNKNEWKRHVASQHLQLGYYRCDMGSCSPETARTQHKGFNDFNRKDLFTQHCRRMHAPWSGSKKGEEGVSKKERDNFEKQLEHIRARCWVDRRKAPQKTKCGFCGKKFVDGKECRGWEERMEHVGRHFERDNLKSKDEDVDDGLKQWAIREGVVREGKKKGEFWLVGFEPVQPSRRSRGQRRSSRLIKEEEIKQDEEVSHNDDNDDDDDESGSSGDDGDSIEAKRADALMKTENSDQEDTDAEAEEDDG
ncbi:uncharacterized protein Z519_11668 [Cladophialophora bantiana CBS 173.52]|uniref:C2H2-type domain-containing protein n=1 Tax=Cladophialophora bantiana (strain ATCC 10958 / CBS 173.52 / CDC B-1940 / NIH 8579) TaxID=1442370 RepID=A0A0D2HTD1_CLAB1|nr:uncharacterized protein Z519_11668 [Cladophialophora bantiana CBS 173.52]KIW87694.1 hypothetical protein Z519_11668 [Cladophialophora bantiana CBS 173.52]